MSEKKVLVEVKDLKKHFTVGKNAILKAVDGIDFKIYKGETLGLVGESGCGKTTCGKTVMGLYTPTEGEIVFDGIKVNELKGKAKKDFTRKAQIIFQDPYSSLDSRMTVGDIIGEGIDIHGLYSGQARTDKIYELLQIIGLTSEHANRFPHEFSGGQRQRIGIARALAIEPEFIVCDEPISALDVSIQAQIINLLIQLQKERQLTYLFIAHDLSMVKHISDRVGVMYLGKMVEMAPSYELYTNPMHPYTEVLMSSIPIPNPKLEKEKTRIKVEGEIPSPINPAPGCRFASRCRYATDLCKEQTPEFREIAPEHYVACHLAEQKK